MALAWFFKFRSFDSLWFDLRAPRSSENVLLLANSHFTSQTTKMSKTTPSTGLWVAEFWICRARECGAGLLWTWGTQCVRHLGWSHRKKLGAISGRNWILWPNLLRLRLFYYVNIFRENSWLVWTQSVGHLWCDGQGLSRFWNWEVLCSAGIPPRVCRVCNVTKGGKQHQKCLTKSNWDKSEVKVHMGGLRSA